jgi:hypothetical protein
MERARLKPPENRSVARSALRDFFSMRVVTNQ